MRPAAAARKNEALMLSAPEAATVVAVAEVAGTVEVAETGALKKVVLEPADGTGMTDTRVALVTLGCFIRTWKVG